MVLNGVMDKNPQKSEIRKYAILTQPRNLTFFEDESFQLFSYLYGLKVPKWNCAHILLWKTAKNIRKTPKNTWFTGLWLRTTLLNDTVRLRLPGEHRPVTRGQRDGRGQGVPRRLRGQASHVDRWAVIGGQLVTWPQHSLWLVRAADGGIHAREWISPATVTGILHTIVENPARWATPHTCT